MRLKLSLFVVPAALAAAVALVSPASGLTGPQTFSLLDVEQSSAELDNFNFSGPPKPGQRFAFTNTLYKWAGTKRGARVGRTEGLCTFTRFSGSIATAHCTASFFLPGGQIYAAAFLRFGEGPGNFAVPVLGGTGIYSNVRGYIRIRDLGQNSGKSNNEFHLTP
jgi:hypothetical protein